MRTPVRWVAIGAREESRNRQSIGLWRSISVGLEGEQDNLGLWQLGA